MKIIEFFNGNDGSQILVVPEDLAHIVREEEAVKIVTKTGREYTMKRVGLEVSESDINDVIDGLGRDE